MLSWIIGYPIPLQLERLCVCLSVINGTDVSCKYPFLPYLALIYDLRICPFFSTFLGERVCDNSTQFQCVSTRRCIPIRLKCDHQHDCRDRSDEANCSSKFSVFILLYYIPSMEGCVLFK